MHQAYSRLLKRRQLFRPIHRQYCNSTNMAKKCRQRLLRKLNHANHNICNRKDQLSVQRHRLHQFMCHPHRLLTKMHWLLIFHRLAHQMCRRHTHRICHRIYQRQLRLFRIHSRSFTIRRMQFMCPNIRLPAICRQRRRHYCNRHRSYIRKCTCQPQPI